MTAFLSFLRLDVTLCVHVRVSVCNTYYYIYIYVIVMYHFFLLHSSVDGHLSIYILVAWTNVAVNMGVQISLQEGGIIE